MWDQPSMCPSVSNNEVKRKLTLISFFHGVSSLLPVVQLPWSHPKSGLPTALISKPALTSLKNPISPAAAEYFLHKLRSARTEKRNLRPHNLLFSFHLQLLKHQKP
uniref:Uncharacterized protein n=1 Tax=Salix viminalis TaxID=40686 RepID=A0A6N2N1Z8_SALVM